MKVYVSLLHNRAIIYVELSFVQHHRQKKTKLKNVFSITREIVVAFKLRRIIQYYIGELSLEMTSFITLSKLDKDLLDTLYIKLSLSIGMKMDLRKRSYLTILTKPYGLIFQVLQRVRKFVS